MLEPFTVLDGLEAIRPELPRVVEMIATTTKWVHPETFRALPVWFPETARGRPSYDASWSSQYKNTNRTTGKTVEKNEPNIKAGKAFKAALGVAKTSNWTVCHIWGVDDPKFQKTNGVVRDPRFYSCVANMVWLPTPLKGFTDAVPEIKLMLRVCAFHLYGWACEHADVQREAEIVRSGAIPEGYPPQWPAPGRIRNPPGTAPFSESVRMAITKRKADIGRMLNDTSLTEFPRTEVREVLAFWWIAL